MFKIVVYGVVGGVLLTLLDISFNVARYGYLVVYERNPIILGVEIALETVSLIYVFYILVTLMCGLFTGGKVKRRHVKNEHKSRFVDAEMRVVPRLRQRATAIISCQHF